MVLGAHGSPAYPHVMSQSHKPLLHTSGLKVVMVNFCSSATETFTHFEKSWAFKKEIDTPTLHVT